MKITNYLTTVMSTQVSRNLFMDNGLNGRSGPHVLKVVVLEFDIVLESVTIPNQNWAASLVMVILQIKIFAILKNVQSLRTTMISEMTSAQIAL